MKRFLVSMLALLFALTMVDATAQSGLLRMIGNAVKSEIKSAVKREVQKEVNRGVNELKNQAQQPREKRQEEQAEQERSSQADPYAQYSESQTSKSKTSKKLQQEQVEEFSYEQLQQPEQAQPVQNSVAQVEQSQQSTESNNSLSTSRSLSLAQASVSDNVQEEVVVSGTVAGHDWVDLGLPSGTRWATCNVNATRASQPGKLYAWGEIATKSSYTMATSKYYNKEVKDISGDPLYDVAAAKWGNGWRMPTRDELFEMLTYCSSDYIQLDGRWVRRMQSYRNGQVIYLPTTGMMDGTTCPDANGCGNYWSSTPDGLGGAFSYIYGAALGEPSSSGRFYGFAIRPVLDKAERLKVPVSGSVDGHDYVDLGLPSGTMWASCNIGADYADQDGLHFAWGETTNIKDFKSKKNDLSKVKDAVCIQGDPRYDTATVLWGANWQMPTDEQCKELISNCTWEFVTLSGRKGYKVASKVNQNWIFLIASGVYNGRPVYEYDPAGGIDERGCYWTSSVEATDLSANYDSNNMAFSDDGKGAKINFGYRFLGAAIRPVTYGNGAVVTQESATLQSFLDKTIKGTGEEVNAMLMELGFKKLGYGMELTGDFLGEMVAVKTYHDPKLAHKYVHWISLGPHFADFGDAESAKRRYNALFEHFSNDTRYEPHQLNKPIREAEDVDFQINENKKRYRAKFYEGGDHNKAVAFSIVKYFNEKKGINTYGVKVNYYNSNYSASSLDYRW